MWVEATKQKRIFLKMSITTFRIFHLFNLYDGGKKLDGKVSTKLQQKTLFLFPLFLVFPLFSPSNTCFLGRFVFQQESKLEFVKIPQEKKS